MECRVGGVLRWRAAQAAAAHSADRQGFGAQPAGMAQPRQIGVAVCAQRQLPVAAGAAQGALRWQDEGQQGVDSVVNFLSMSG